MPASKDINSYPIDLYRLVEGVLDLRKSATVACASDAERRAFRRQVYNLRHAIMATPSHPLAADAPRLATRNGPGFALILCHIDDAPLPSGVKAALAAMEGSK